MTYILGTSILVVLILILYSFHLFRISYNKGLADKIKLRRVRNTHFPIFSEQELIEKKILKDNLFHKIKELDAQFSHMTRQARQLKQQSRPFSITGANNSQLEQLAKLVLRKNQANDQFDKMMKLNLAVFHGQLSYDKAWTSAYDVTNDNKSSQKDHQYINDFIAGKKRLLKKAYDQVNK